MNTNKISKLYLFNTYISLIPLVAICVFFTILLLFSKEGIYFLMRKYIEPFIIIVALPFPNQIVNTISLIRRKDFWNVLYLIVNIIILCSVTLILAKAFGSSQFILPGGKSSIIFGLIIAIPAIFLCWLWYIDILTRSQGGSLIGLLMLICLIIWGYLICRGKFNSKLFLISSRILYIVLLLTNIILMFFVDLTKL